MRKRAQRRSELAEIRHHMGPREKEKKRIAFKKNWWVAVALVGIFFLTLFLTTAFNYNSGTTINEAGETLSETFYLSGPDPYYNMRSINITLLLLYNVDPVTFIFASLIGTSSVFVSFSSSIASSSISYSILIVVELILVTLIL
ncbi:hypothetical protein MBGDC06_00398 [Thermoplasmatales archaeon SCGC AB-539-C06]|nr:hypothetical protein MBGDC06_00398 [Thermoplasmatales archaeon SCGC AB-539-C06]